MCEHYTPCKCLAPKLKPRKPLSLLLLDCWQREYDKRPYKHFRFSSLDFEERMGRNLNSEKDFAIVVQFLKERKLCSAVIIGVQLFARQHMMLESFVAALFELKRIELRLMQLPTAFFTLFQKNTEKMKVKHLNLKGTPLNDQDSNELWLFLIRSKTLQSMNVAACNLNHSRFAVLADGFHKSKTLRSINCSRLISGQLTLETTKIAHILSSLIWQNKLVELTMQNCNLIAQDMEILAEYMYRSDSVLEKLDLGYNIIASDGADYLFRAITSSGTMKRLNIAGNGLGPHGADVVAKYLSASYFLQYLDIGYNGIKAEGINMILTTMKKPIPLQQLKLYGNAFNTRTANILRRLLAALVVPQDTIDITVTFDESLNEYRVIPCAIDQGRSKP